MGKSNNKWRVFAMTKSYAKNTSYLRVLQDTWEAIVWAGPVPITSFGDLYMRDSVPAIRGIIYETLEGKHAQ